MIPVLFALAAALPFTNANVDQRAAAGNLEATFRGLVAAQSQPAWIAWSVPAARASNLDCEFVSHDGNWSSTGTVHLEPPGHAIILFRVEAAAVDRIRSLSPYCEIDAGGLAVHWLTDVAPAESVALLATYVGQHDLDGNGSIPAIAVHADAAADRALDKLVAPDQAQSIRLRAVSWMGRSRGAHGFAVLKNLIATDDDPTVRERAVSALRSSKEPGALDLLIATARTDRSPRLRAQAASELGHSAAPNVVGVLTGIIATDTDSQVTHRAVGALQNLPDGAGVPTLIQLVRTTQNADVRKQAMNALSRTKDPRALAFFEEVLARE